MANYFDEATMFALWQNENRTPSEDRFYYDKIGQVINGVIFTHKFMRFGFTFDDLRSEGFIAVLTALPKFDPEYINPQGKKTTLFNYISLVAKRALIFYTIRENKKSGSEFLDNTNVNDLDLFHHEKKTYIGLAKLLHKFISNSTVCYKEVFYIMANEIEEFIKSGEVPIKKNLYPFLKKYGSLTQIRHLFKIMKEHKSELYEFLQR